MLTLTPSDSGCLLIKLFQSLPAEVDIENFFTGLGSFGMAPRPGAACLARSQRSRATQVLVHQGKRSTGDERKEDQVDSSQKVVQGWKALSISLVQRNVNRCPRFRWPMPSTPSFDLNSGTVSIRGPRAGEIGGLAGSGIGAHQQAIRRRGTGNDLERQVLIRLQRQGQLLEQPHHQQPDLQLRQRLG